MGTEDPTSRPVGWWLKEADARLDLAFDRAFGAVGRTRREWQVLSTLARRPTTHGELVSALAAFGPPRTVEVVVERLVELGEVVSEEGLLHLTALGQRVQGDLGHLADDVRRRVRAALPEADYIALVRLLARLVDGLEEPRSD
jgi:hypothetical protein